MNAAVEAEAASSSENGARPASPATHSVVSPSSFLSGIAMLLRESVQQFESISGGITEAVMSKPGLVDRELVVTLQAFDRLQQEFVAVADILTRYSGSMQTESDGAGHIWLDGDAAIAAIAMSDLKERLLYYLQREQSGSLEPPPDGEQIF